MAIHLAEGFSVPAKASAKAADRVSRLLRSQNGQIVIAPDYRPRFRKRFKQHYVSLDGIYTHRFHGALEEAYEAMLDAKSAELDGDEDEAVEQWCRVFGDAFRSLSAPEEE